jgi:hypothetical protein
LQKKSYYNQAQYQTQETYHLPQIGEHAWRIDGLFSAAGLDKLWPKPRAGRGSAEESGGGRAEMSRAQAESSLLSRVFAIVEGILGLATESWFLWAGVGSFSGSL